MAGKAPCAPLAGVAQKIASSSQAHRIQFQTLAIIFGGEGFKRF
jgi:hypothetical protein